MKTNSYPRGTDGQPDRADAQKIAWKLAAKWKRRHSELLGYVEHSRAYEVNRCMNELKRAFKIKP